jgi:hypothetical protein
MKKLLVAITTLTLALVLVACGAKEATASGYGLAHKIYVGAAELTVDKDGEVLSGSFEEYYLPYNIAIVAEPADDATDVVYGNSHGDKAFAKYFQIGDVLFTGADSAMDSEGSYTDLPAYTNANGDELLAWIAIEANAKAYVEGTQDGTVFIANADGTKHATYATPVGDEWTKSATGYGGDSFDWQGQMDAIIASLVGTSMSGSYSQNSDNLWVVDDVVSGATLVDYAQYYAVAQRAYDNAMAEFE